MAYATAAQFMERYDARVLGDLCSDLDDQIEPTALLTNTKLQAALDDASGDIDAALVTGQRYTTDDLEGLTGNSQKHLIRITCDIAFAFLQSRRGSMDAESRKAHMDVAEAHLERLRKGLNIFDLDAQKDAGVPESTGPTRVDFQNMNLIRDRTKNYYPARRLPYNR